jgi:iron complex transport system permease protein
LRSIERGRRATPARLILTTAGAAALLGAALLAALGLGVEHIDLRRAWSDPTSTDAAILFGARLSRALLALAVGAALAGAGVAFQALLRNPLADPYVLGISGGASVAGTAAIVLGAAAGRLGTWALPAWSFLGALGSMMLVFAFGRVRGRLVPNVALLAGVVVNALSNALVVAIRIVASPQTAHQALYWLTGSLAPAEPLRLYVLFSYVAVGLLGLLALAVPMNAFALGEEAAHAVGVETEAARRRIFLAGSLLTGAAVAFAGPIGFVGIVVPHFLRALIGPDHRLLLPASALVGGAFLVAADTGARLAFLALGTEPTVGVLTALVGAPLFLIMLRRRGAERVL